MTENLYWVFELAINPGRFEDLKTLMAAMVEATQRNEVGTLNYEWAISGVARTKRKIKHAKLCLVHYTASRIKTRALLEAAFQQERRW